MGEAAISDDLRPGRRIEVRSRFDRSWTRGFEVVESGPEGYTIRRLSDGSVLPAIFDAEDVRRERKQGLWWY